MSAMKIFKAHEYRIIVNNFFSPTCTKAKFRKKLYLFKQILP